MVFMSVSFDDYVLMLEKVAKMGLELRRDGMGCMYKPCHTCRAHVKDMSLTFGDTAGGYTCMFLMVDSISKGLHNE
jgi:hypothetical protein